MTDQNDTLPDAQRKLLVLGALIEGPKSLPRLRQITGLSHAAVYLALVDLKNDGRVSAQGDGWRSRP